MNAFTQCRGIEAEGVRDLLPYLRLASYEGRFVFTNDGRFCKEFQKKVGDVMMATEDGYITAEIKSDNTDRNTFFLETWSNKCYPLQTPGWMDTMRSDLLLYYFIKHKRLFVISMKRLYDWSFVNENGTDHDGHPRYGRLQDFPEKFPGIEQKNVTSGVSVPISVIKKEVGYRAFNIDGENITELHDSFQW